MNDRAKASSTGGWQPLKRGDLIDVIAPGSGCPPDMMKAGLRRLHAWGLRTRVPLDLIGNEPFVAQTEAVRWRHLRAALHAQDSDAIWAVRGGYGCMHLAARLSRTRPPSRPKPLIGFSDVTALTSTLDQVWGWRAIHGPVLAQLRPDAIARADLLRIKRMLFGLLPEQSFGTLRCISPSARMCDVATISGRLTGGNLATLQSLCGSSIQPNLRRKIVFLEDVNERGYAIDRMLRTMEAAGAFRGAEAVVFGEFLNAEENNGNVLVNAAMNNLAARLRCPVFVGLPVGHGKRLPPLVVGAQATITSATASGRWRLQCDSGYAC